MSLIILVEDDDIQADFVLALLRSRFPGVHVIWVQSESEFYVRLEEGSLRRATALILDCRLRWGRHSPAPREILEQGPYRAGVRLIKRLLSDYGGKCAPVCLRTIYEYQGIEEDLATCGLPIHYLGKSVSDNDRLLAWTERWLAAEKTISIR